MKKNGTVYFIGAGPGDPGLLTRRGEFLLKKADDVIYDRLVHPDIVAMARTAQKIYVGKEQEEGDASQTTINRILVRKAQAGRLVIRLKGGDPTLFGRISEEMSALVKAKIPFEIVPGVSSAWAAAASLGIPLTDRRYSSSLAIMTGQEALHKKRRVDWERLARAVDTVVILMGAALLPKIVRAFRRGRKSSATPIALIQWATTPQQKFLISTLGQVEKEVKNIGGFEAPLVIIIGEVVRLSKKFSGLPLKGRRILITRSADDALGLTRQLKNFGAECVPLPTISIRSVRLSRAESETLAEELFSCDWIIFNSRHGVEAFRKNVGRHPMRRLADGKKPKICAVGPRTAQAVREAGLRVDLTPTHFSREGIQEVFQKIPLKGKKIFVPRSTLAIGDSFAALLRRFGALVDEKVMYETTFAKTSPETVRKAIRHLDTAAFTSVSTVRGFMKTLALSQIPLRQALNGARIVAIGSSTAKALKQAGVKQVSVPSESGTMDSFVQTIIEVTS